MSGSPTPSAEERFTAFYATPRPPWDIGRPQEAFVEAAEEIARRGSSGPSRVLDIGCGTGDLAIFLSGLGCVVTGVDFLAAPLDQARRKAGDLNAAVTFLKMDARFVGQLPERFDAVTDCGLFHTFDDSGRAAYVSSLAALLEPGARVFLLCFADAEPGTHGPRRVRDVDLREAFAHGWEFERLDPARFESVPGIPGAEFTPGGAHAWFAVIRRQPSPPA